MFKAIRVPVYLRRPARPQAPAALDQRNAARIWEAARMAEKVNDNYCIPTPAGFVIRVTGKLQQITGDTAAQARAIAAQIGVDPEDWILYLYSLGR